MLFLFLPSMCLRGGGSPCLLLVPLLPLSVTYQRLPGTCASKGHPCWCFGRGSAAEDGRLGGVGHLGSQPASSERQRHPCGVGNPCALPNASAWRVPWARGLAGGSGFPGMGWSVASCCSGELSLPRVARSAAGVL